MAFTIIEIIGNVSSSDLMLNTYGMMMGEDICFSQKQPLVYFCKRVVSTSIMFIASVISHQIKSLVQ